MLLCLPLLTFLGSSQQTKEKSIIASIPNSQIGREQFKNTGFKVTVRSKWALSIQNYLRVVLALVIAKTCWWYQQTNLDLLPVTKD